MKRHMLAAALAAATVLGAAPAAIAHETRDHRVSEHRYDRHGYRQNHPYAYRSAQQIDRLRYRVRNARRDGHISRYEARNLRREIRNVERVRTLYIRTRGMSHWEARDLRNRIDRLRFHVRRAIRHDNYARRWR